MQGINAEYKCDGWYTEETRNLTNKCKIFQSKRPRDIRWNDDNFLRIDPYVTYYICTCRKKRVANIDETVATAKKRQVFLELRISLFDIASLKLLRIRVAVLNGWNKENTWSNNERDDRTENEEIPVFPLESSRKTDRCCCKLCKTRLLYQRRYLRKELWYSIGRVIPVSQSCMRMEET